jgi:acyl-CoA hydrolase
MSATGQRTPDPDASGVLAHVGSHDDVIVPLANGEPVTVLDALEAAAAAGELDGVRVHQMHALHDRPSIRGELGDRMRHVSYFLSPVTRPAFLAGHCELVPNHFSEVPSILQHCTKASAVLAAASPMDAHGYFSLGTSCDYVAPLIGRSPFYLEVNEQMPRTFGRNQLHVSQVAGWTEVDRPLVEHQPASPGPADLAIAAHVAERIPDGATLQVGIGAIPNALLAALGDHRDLGVHTELLSDGIVDLVERGVVTGTAKRLTPHKVVTTFALGTRRLYDFLHENTAVELHPVSWVNDPRVIARDPTSRRSTPPSRWTSSGSARRRRGPGSTGRRAGARPTSPGVPCTPRVARASSSSLDDERRAPCRGSCRGCTAGRWSRPSRTRSTRW